MQRLLEPKTKFGRQILPDLGENPIYEDKDRHKMTVEKNVDFNGPIRPFILIRIVPSAINIG